MFEQLTFVEPSRKDVFDKEECVMYSELLVVLKSATVVVKR